MTNDRAVEVLKAIIFLLDRDIYSDEVEEAIHMAISALTAQPEMHSCDCIERQAAIDVLEERLQANGYTNVALVSELNRSIGYLRRLPSAQPEIIRCKDCKWWRQQTNYQGAPLSFGFCESDDMWRSLYGETYEVSHIDTDDDFYCGYAERRTDDSV